MLKLYFSSIDFCEDFTNYKTTKGKINQGVSNHAKVKARFHENPLYGDKSYSKGFDTAGIYCRKYNFPKSKELSSNKDFIMRILRVLKRDMERSLISGKKFRDNNDYFFDEFNRRGDVEIWDFRISAVKYLYNYMSKELREDMDIACEIYELFPYSRTLDYLPDSFFKNLDKSRLENIIKDLKEAVGKDEEPKESKTEDEPENY